MPGKQRQAKYQNDYIRRKYDRLNILVPQGQKDVITDAAYAAGESLNQFVNKAILGRLEQLEWLREGEGWNK